MCIRHIRSIALFLILPFLHGCISQVWTGVNWIYDRHSIYKQISDFQLGADVNRALYHDKRFKMPGTSLDVAIFNGDVLIAGHVSNQELWREGKMRIMALKGIRRFFYQVSAGQVPHDIALRDDWITAKIRSRIVADSSIDPHAFKVITMEGIVYLMGDVLPNEALKVIQMARQTYGARRVVVLLRYYHVSDRPLGVQ